MSKNRLISYLAISAAMLSISAFRVEAQAPINRNDQAVIRQLLDRIGRKDTQVEDVTQFSRDGRALKLDLSRRGIDGAAMSEFPMEVLKLDALKGLILRNNNITVLPPEIGQMRELIELNLAGNPIGTLPITIGNLGDNLRILDLRNTGLTGLPPEFGNLRKLEVLQLWGNDFVMLPDWILELENLKELYLKGNKLITLPIGIMNLKNLTYLDIHQNNICDLPPEVHEWLIARGDRRYRMEQGCQ